MMNAMKTKQQLTHELQFLENMCFKIATGNITNMKDKFEVMNQEQIKSWG